MRAINALILVLALAVSGFAQAAEPPPADTPAIIFRMDDAERGVREHVVERIIKLFEANGVPLDIGVVPHAKGRDSFEMPFLKKYLQAGVIAISMHGYDHTYREFDTRYSGTNYRELRAKLTRARKRYRSFFGVSPLAFTPAYDFFDAPGYRAIRDAGFKVFSTQEAVEEHPSVEPVDYFGHPDPAGMCRIFTALDVTDWDQARSRWGEVNPMSMIRNNIRLGFDAVGVAVLSIHPQAFVDARDVIDPRKLEQLDAIIKFAKTQGVVTTFEGWYNSRVRAAAADGR